MKTQNTLADLRPEVAHLDVACSRCDRRGRLNVARLIQEQVRVSRCGMLSPGSTPIVSVGSRMPSWSDARSTFLGWANSFNPVADISCVLARYDWGPPSTRRSLP